jgi:hypothetical protein
VVCIRADRLIAFFWHLKLLCYQILFEIENFKWEIVADFVQKSKRANPIKWSLEVYE